MSIFAKMRAYLFFKIRDMRIKIILLVIILVVLGGTSTLLGLPFVTDSLIYAYLSGYVPLLHKGLSLLMIIISAYIASISLNLILTKSSATVIRQNALAKKVFPLIHWTISIAVWIVAVFFVLGALGINIAALVTGAGIGGVMFALASKEFIANLFGSLSLIFSKNFKIGDTIKVKGYEGVVDEISLSYTRLIDKRGTVIFMPNKLIISETVENLSMAPTKKLEFPCVLPGLDIKNLKKTLESIEKDIKKLSGDELQVSSSIDSLTEKGYNVTLKIETAMESVSGLKKEVWMLLGERVRGE